MQKLATIVGCYYYQNVDRAANRNSVVVIIIAILFG